MLAVCVAIVLIGGIHRLTITISQLLLIRAGGQLVRRLRCRVNEHLHRLSLRYHDRSKVGDSLYRVAYDTQAAQTLLNGAVVPMLSGTVLLVGILTIMLQLDIMLTLIAVAIAPVFLVLIRGFGRGIQQRSSHYHAQESQLVSSLQESLSSIRAIQAFTRERETNDRFQAQAGQSLEANQRLILVQLVFSACVGLAMSVGTAAVVWFGAQRVLDGSLSVGDVLVFLAYLGMLYQPMSALSEGTSVVQSSRTQLQRVFEILDTPCEVADGPHPLKPASVSGRLQFRDVSFEYEPHRPVLRNINVNVEPGQVVALVGHTGAGKSTLASLLLRFYDPTEGQILLDGNDLRAVEMAWLRSQVGIVLQDAILFSATVGENIAYGKLDASQAEVELAARRAQADEFIRKLPNGYDTMPGERGVNLSGGQRQRLAIARAFLKDAPILILDEPTSALDAQTEQALMAALQELARGRTTFIVAHRLSTLRMAHRILVLKNGEIVEEGTHEELMSREGVYQKMHSLQFNRSSELTAAYESH